MSDVVAQAVTALNEKLGGEGIDGTAQFNIEGEGSMIVDSEGAREGEGDADVTFNADADTYREIFDGSLDPTSAFMSGRLTIDGDMGMAMKLAASLA
ncbi:SCP2 sterol-binding domain-containing protein [Marivita sp. S6314]|uniref:SCP2 sterol-binding domain-containing protein n=1 Tax=Marivita sp. S6314 TaxID=2926406 RepID=UPI001FF4D048|nr:SCP2 sterol-binding domain-containing protein [Marivita sp. S6314]MCK0151066.1 SCP2 sterol-binding domain-containing protein [Marivita sp. S6314]